MVTDYSLPESVAAYTQARADAGTSVLVGYLETLLPHGAALLELGIGPGKELVALSGKFDVTGSDNSAAFLEAFAKAHPAFRILKLDAATIETKEKFDCIFSNKVLHHLSPDDLRASLRRQKRRLNPGGLLCHSFWLGDAKKCGAGLYFCKYTKRELIRRFSRIGTIELCVTYSDLNSADSLAIAVSVPFARSGKWAPASCLSPFQRA